MISLALFFCWTAPIDIDDDGNDNDAIAHLKKVSK
jgi:hypothetical protein